MPKFATFDPEENVKKIESSGNSKATEIAQSFVDRHFNEFVSQKLGKASMMKIFEDNSTLERILIEYFDTYRLSNGELPSRSTLNAQRSHIKMRILKDSKGAIDINNKNVFPDFHRLWKGQMKVLKQAGKGDVKHNQAIPDPVCVKLFKLLVVLTDLLQQDENHPEFEENLMKLPSEWREEYHDLVLYGAIFIFVLQVSSF